MINKERLKELRKESGLNQADVAAKLNIRRETYTKYETGAIQPPSDMILAISNFFEVSADWLLNNTNEKTQLTEQKKSLDKTLSDIENNVKIIFENYENSTIKQSIDNLNTIFKNSVLEQSTEKIEEMTIEYQERIEIIKNIFENVAMFDGKQLNKFVEVINFAKESDSNFQKVQQIVEILKSKE